MARLAMIYLTFAVALLIVSQVLAGSHNRHHQSHHRLKGLRRSGGNGDSKVPPSQSYKQPKPVNVTATPTATASVQGIPQPTSELKIQPKKPKKIDNRNVCRSFTETFDNPRIVRAERYNGNPASADWINLSGSTKTYTVKNGFLSANLLPPANPKPEKSSNGPFNKNLGLGLTLNSTYLMHYGTVSAKLKANPVGGVVTAFITMSPVGDEIDWEMVGKDVHHAQSNYFWSELIVYGVNGGIHNVPGGGIAAEFHTYKIEWTPDSITWAIDNQTVRTSLRKDTFKQGQFRFPSTPSYIQLGIWDGSGSSGTAQWSNGPIDWRQHRQPLSSIFDEVTIDCNKQFNHVI